MSLYRFRVRGDIKRCSLKVPGVKNLPSSCPNDGSRPLYNPYPKKEGVAVVKGRANCIGHNWEAVVKYLSLIHI